MYLAIGVFETSTLSIIVNTIDPKAVADLLIAQNSSHIPDEILIITNGANCPGIMHRYIYGKEY